MPNTTQAEEARPLADDAGSRRVLQCPSSTTMRSCIGRFEGEARNLTVCRAPAIWNPCTEVPLCAGRPSTAGPGDESAGARILRGAERTGIGRAAARLAGACSLVAVPAFRTPASSLFGLSPRPCRA
jgi:hypothetical protein